MRQLEQEYSEPAEGESDLKRMCQPGESCRNQVGSQLLLQLQFLKPQYKEKYECDGGREYGNNKPCMFLTPAYRRTFLSQGKHPDS